VSSGEIGIHNCTFLRNRAKNCGGAIHISTSNLSLSGTYNLFNDNLAKNGGGICSEHGIETNTITNSSTKHLNFTENVANSSGGAIYAQICSLLLGITTKNIQ
jgi:predicted outer membrane repeat protein